MYLDGENRFGELFAVISPDGEFVLASNFPVKRIAKSKKTFRGIESKFSFITGDKGVGNDLESVEISGRQCDDGLADNQIFRH